MRESIIMSLGSLREPGPGFLPFYAAAIMSLLTLIHLIKAFVTVKHSKPVFTSFANLRHLIFTIIIAFITAILFESLGFIITSVFFLIFILKFVGRESWLKTIPITLVVLIFSYLVFIVFLNIQLPMGPLDFF
jgi:hypothetical protein